MKCKLLSAFLGLMIAAAAPAPLMGAPVIDDYRSVPFWLDGQTVPHVLLVLERDWKMFYPAYNNLADLDGDGALDIGFNPAVAYTGYFDSNSCYSYNRTGSATNPVEEGEFTRVGPTTPQTQAQADALAISRGIDQTNLKYPASAHGVCGGGSSSDRTKGLGQWHGNWLNYAMTSRMDAIRKVLYGGKRTTDTPTHTVLELVRVPANANVWGGELYADDLWEEYAPSSPWYAIELFTGFDAPGSKEMHFWARGDYYWSNPEYSNPDTASPTNTSVNQSSARKNPVPLFRVATNIPSTNRHPFLRTPLRIWDWSGDHSSYNGIPSDGHLANSRNPGGAINNGFMPGPNTVAWHFAARVEVCQKGNYSETEGCRGYGENFKPIGLLQQYGESGRMYFGLLTGTISHPSPWGELSGTRYKGGVVRHHIQNFSNYVKGDGTVVRPGLIDTIDSFEITGIGSGRSYTDGSQAGNPLGEMVWEGLRYLGGAGTNPQGAGAAYTAAGGLNPTSAYGAGGNESSVTSVTGASVKLPKLTTWDKRPVLEGNANECPKPVILAISEVIPDRDGDDLPGSSTADFPGVKYSNFVKTPHSGLSETFSLNTYLDVITDVDKLSTPKSGKQFFYSDNRGLCTAKNLSGGLKDISGHCPSEPSLKGSYSLAAVAYYAHTHDFNSLSGDAGKANNVDFYAVGIPGNFPDITLSFTDDLSVTLMPIALSAPLDAPSNRTEGTADDFRTLLNFFIEYWQTDDGHTYVENGVTKTRKIPYKVKFRTNFEFTTNPCFAYNGNSNNWERDLFSAITITLLANQSTPSKYREEEPLFISSGPFKTRNKSLYLSQRATYRSTGNAGVFTGQPYYYAFKKPKGETLDLNSLKDHWVGVAVHSDSVGSGYGASGLTGYTISGVTFPGGYLDVGLNRGDYPIYYSNASGQPNRSIFVPNAARDEAVPLDPAGSGLPGAQFDFHHASGTHSTPSGFSFHGTGSVITNGADCGYYHPPTMWDHLLTPAECPYAGYLDDPSKLSSDPDLAAAYPELVNGTMRGDEACGRWAAGFVGSGNSKSYPTNNSQEWQLFKTSKMRYVQVRSFRLDDSANKPATLPNPMWLAAKYGGFRDSDGNGVPNVDGEWKRGGVGVLGSEDPYNYFGVANMSQLAEQLGNAFETIANSVATGTANASSISSVLGGGVSIQTQYRTEYEDPDNPATKVKWPGAVYAFFVDKWGNLRADTNGDGKLNLVTSPAEEDWAAVYPGGGPYDGKLGDLIVHIVSPAVGSAVPTVYLCHDIYGNNNGGNSLPKGPGQHPPTGYPGYAKCKPQPNLDAVPALWNAAQQISDMAVADRKLYTYYGPTIEAGKAWSSVNLTTYPFEYDGSFSVTHKLYEYLGMPSLQKAKDIIDYTRGIDVVGYRNRTARLPWDPAGGAKKVWRMGDVINSRPVIVGEPSSNYHVSYDDETYSDYRNAQARRRQVAYFGSNDGILHAVNVGYFGALKHGLAGYSINPDPDDPTANKALGAELWGFIPPSLLPHLQWVASEAYQHSYYVDLTPQIVDIKDSLGNWRTIMIVGLRLGGRTIELVNSGSEPHATSEYFAMDVTDPDAPPTLLWRFSHLALGQSTAKPAIVRQGTKWYVVLPSGPAQIIEDPPTLDPNVVDGPEVYNGVSNSKARVFVLDALTGEYVRDRDKNPSAYIGVSDPLMVEEKNSFFGDTFVPRATNVDKSGLAVEWTHHTVYLGVTSNSKNNEVDSGAVYRIKMVDSTGAALPVNQWKLHRLYKTNKPLTAPVNSTYDRLGNLWVLFGTGRIWGRNDLMPCGAEPVVITCADDYEQYLFGLKEPMDQDPVTKEKYMNFKEIIDGTSPPIVDVSGIKVYDRGALRPDPNPTGAIEYEAFYSSMLNVVSGTTPQFSGWKRKMPRAPGVYLSGAQNVFELVNTQVKLDALANGRVNAAVSAYLPSDNICEPLGEAGAYIFDAFTGLPAPYMSTYGGLEGDTITVTINGTPTATTEVTGALPVGAGMASEMTVVKTDNATIYRPTGFGGQQPQFMAEGGTSVNAGFVSWREVLDMGFDLKEGTNKLFDDL